MSPPERLCETREILTPADHQTHRGYRFRVPSSTRQLAIRVSYAPKRISAEESVALAQAALAQQASALAARVGRPLAEQWATEYGPVARRARIANLLTMSLDDADGTYRGAGHRQANDQHLVLGSSSASPGLVAGALPPGVWTLTISAHTLVSDQCELSISIDAEIASSR